MIEPIIEAIAEVRFFSPRFVEQPVPIGPVMAMFGSQFPNLEETAAKRVPFELRGADESFRFAATYQMSNSNSRILLGDRSVAFTSTEYGGWDNFKARLHETVRPIIEMFEAGVTRVSVRYVNLLSGDGVKKQLARTKVLFPFDAIGREPSSFQSRVDFRIDDLVLVLQVATNVEAKRGDSAEVMQGAVIDIDSILEKRFEAWAEVEDGFERVHALERDTFFKLLSSDTISSFKPVYHG
ncbi:TIGR04255 family protein [Dokdonella sp.]|uniref:TIGR04255 family protein n=1 Tax=Dokdonella sp. TaxID=2291710 RepID=UPI003784EB15